MSAARHLTQQFVAQHLVSSPGSAGAGAWTFEPITTVALVLFAGAVFAGARRSRRVSGSSWTGWRAASFSAGIAIGLLAVDGWPGVYARTLFSVFISQQLVLLLISPLLIACGRPLGPLRVLFPSVSLPHPLARVLGVLTHAVVGPALVPVAMSVVAFTSLPADMAHHILLAGVVHVFFIALGLAIAAPFARDVAHGSSLAFGLALSVGILELLIDAVPGIVLRLNSHVLASVTDLAARRTWGPSRLLDQQAGGDIWWCVAEALDLPFLIVVVVQWIRADTQEARRIDAELDRAAHEAALRRPVTVAEATAPAGESGPADVTPARDRPWWEKDARVFGDARSRALQDPLGRPGRSGGDGNERPPA
jgi:putative membrane protein